jgi:mannose-6-phosphate isomerase-like protein (cupin superfamily)
VVVSSGSVPAIDFGGLGIRDYTAAIETSSSFAVITVPPGVAHALSWSRRSDKCYYVVTGTIEFTDSGQTHVLSTGDVCLVSQG